MFRIVCKVTGDIIETTRTLEEAETILEEYETEDKKDGTYEDGFYEIVEESGTNGKFFVKTLSYNGVAVVIDGFAIMFDCETLEDAKNMDFSNLDGVEDIEEAAINCNKKLDDIYYFNTKVYVNVIEL